MQKQPFVKSILKTVVFLLVLTLYLQVPLQVANLYEIFIFTFSNRLQFVSFESLISVYFGSLVVKPKVQFKLKIK